MSQINPFLCDVCGERLCDHSFAKQEPMRPVKMPMFLFRSLSRVMAPNRGVEQDAVTMAAGLALRHYPFVYQTGQGRWHITYTNRRDLLVNLREYDEERLTNDCALLVDVFDGVQLHRGVAAWVVPGSLADFGAREFGAPLVVVIAQDLPDVRAQVEFYRPPPHCYLPAKSDPMSLVSPTDKLRSVTLTLARGKMYVAHTTGGKPLVNLCYQAPEYNLDICNALDADGDRLTWLSWRKDLVP